MTLPHGLSTSHSSQVCKLHKSLYILKQANRKWYSKLSSFLLSLGYYQSQADHFLYVKSTTTNFIDLLVYVDDIVLAGNCLYEIQFVMRLMDHQFKIKDLGQLRYCLGFEIAISNKDIFMNHKKYTLQFLENTGFLAVKPSSVPFDPNLKLSLSDGQPLDDPSTYRSSIGILIYLTNSRPDISYDVKNLSQFVSKPLIVHYQAITKILGTSNLSLLKVSCFQLLVV